MEETVVADACVDSIVSFVHNRCIVLLYGRRCLPYEARNACVAVCHTFSVVGYVLPSEGSVLRLICAVVAMSIHLFVLRRRLAIIKLLARGSRFGTRCKVASLVT